VRIFTTHLRRGAEPRLVREGFSLSGAVFGALWLAVQGSWIPAALTALAAVVAWRIALWLQNGAVVLGFAVLQGLLVRDLLRWNLSLRGFETGPVIAAPDEDAALFRLLEQRPDLTAGAA
jgi:hypothetical protein